MLPSDLSEVAERITNELEDAIEQLHGLSCAAHARLLEQIAAYETTECYRFDGVADVATWLQCRLGLSHATAHEWARAARALRALPCISAAYAEGSLSWDQVRELVKFATPDTDGDLADQSRNWTIAELQIAARRARGIAQAKIDEAERRRFVRWHHDDDRAWMHLRARLPSADGALVAVALERIAKQVHPSGEVREPALPYEHRLADALVEICSQDLDADFDGARPTLVVHVDAGSLQDEGGVAEIVDGPPLSIPTALRLGCDSSKEVSVEDAARVPTGIGRKSRQVPHWLYRQLRHRDRGCRFPECGRTRWVNAHHIVHWAHGGSTDRENLVLLCGSHHKLVHEGGWKLTGHPDRSLTFIKPNGKPLRTGPPPLRDEIRERLPLLL